MFSTAYISAVAPAGLLTVSPDSVRVPSGDRLALRLVAEGVNASKQPLRYEPITFGFPGARVGGQVTFGNELRVLLPRLTRSS